MLYTAIVAGFLTHIIHIALCAPPCSTPRTRGGDLAAWRIVTVSAVPPACRVNGVRTRVRVTRFVGTRVRFINTRRPVRISMAFRPRSSADPNGFAIQPFANRELRLRRLPTARGDQDG